MAFQWYIQNILSSQLFKFGSVTHQMKVIKLQSKYFLSIYHIRSLLLGFSNCGVIDNVLNLLRQQLLERDGFPSTTSSHINPEDFF